MTDEEKYKLTLFVLVKINAVLPICESLGIQDKTINELTVDACENLMDMIDFEKVRKEYEDGIDKRKM